MRVPSHVMRVQEHGSVRLSPQFVQCGPLVASYSARNASHSAGARDADEPVHAAKEEDAGARSHSASSRHNQVTNDLRILELLDTSCQEIWLPRDTVVLAAQVPTLCWIMPVYTHPRVGYV